jgi:hypothetical protein
LAWRRGVFLAGKSQKMSSTCHPSPAQLISTQSFHKNGKIVGRSSRLTLR